MEPKKDAPATPKKPFEALTISRDFSILLASLVVVALGFGILTPIMPKFAEENLGLDAAEIGFIYSLFAVSFTVCMLPAGYLADKFGRKPLIVAGTAIFGLTTLMLVFITEAWQFALLRILEGVGAAIVTPAAFALTVDIVPEDKRGVAMGAEAAAELAGALGGPGLGGFLAEYLGYQAPFFLAAVLAFACSALVLLIREQHLPAREERLSMFTMFQAWRRNAAKNRALLAVTSRGFVIGIVQGLWNLGLILYWYDEIEMTAGQVGAAVSVEVLVMLVGSIPFGSASDRYGRKPFIVIGGALMTVGLLFNVVITDAWHVYLLMAVSGIGSSMSNPSVGGMLADVMSAEERGRVMGVYQFILGIGNIIGYTLLGYMYEAVSHDSPIILGSVAFAVATSIVAVFVAETHRAPAIVGKKGVAAGGRVSEIYGGGSGDDLQDD